jgi:Na+-driven multidrug efflux pump
VIAFGGEYMRIVSINFIAAGIVFTASSVFQGIGNTLPPLLSSMTRLVMFALPAIAVAHRPGFQVKYVWYLSVVSQILQALINLLLLRRELRKKLVFHEVPLGAVAPG